MNLVGYLGGNLLISDENLLKNLRSVLEQVKNSLSSLFYTSCKPERDFYVF